MSKTPFQGGAVIVTATADDAGAISRLAGVIWRAVYPEIISTAQIEYMLSMMYSEKMLREELLGDVRYFLLKVDGVLSGYASLSATERPGVVKLHKLYLLSELQGRGLGSFLLQHCERAARAVGERKMILNVNKRNVRAIAAYERNGFCIESSVVNDIGGGFVMDDFVMAKALAV